MLTGASHYFRSSQVVETRAKTSTNQINMDKLHLPKAQSPMPYPQTNTHKKTTELGEFRHSGRHLSRQRSGRLEAVNDMKLTNFTLKSSEKQTYTLSS